MFVTEATILYHHMFLIQFRVNATQFCRLVVKCQTAQVQARDNNCSVMSNTMLYCFHNEFFLCGCIGSLEPLNQNDTC